MKRKLVYTSEYMAFMQDSNQRTRDKLSYVVSVLGTVPQIPAKFVKKLVNTDFYELRVSVDNEVRVILFSADNENINLATKVILLNGFVKKSTKDYDRELVKAANILNNLDI